MPFLPKYPEKRDDGFSLLELVVIVMVVGLLTGITIPFARNMILDSKAQRIIEVSDRLRSACQRFWIDVGRPAIEGPDGMPHELYEGGPGVRNWRGPYIDHPLTSRDFPDVVTSASISNSLDGNGGFYLQGAMGMILDGAGNCLVLDKVELELAQTIDEQLDHSLIDEERPRVGRVVYNPLTPPGGTTPLYIFLIGSP